MSKPVKKRSAWRWALIITGWSFVLALTLSLLSQTAISAWGLVPSILILLLFVAIGISFDMLGLAAASVSEKPFRAMSARRVRGAEQSLWLILRADKVSSFCNDVVGDISGIISGATCSVIAASLTRGDGISTRLTPLLLSAAVAALTVGGKALGKNIALRKNISIILFAGRLLWFFNRRSKK